MPNGKGALECCYCRHFQSSSGYAGYDSAYEAGWCNHWQLEIPTTLPAWNHRICADFAPNDAYERDNRQMMEYHGESTAESVGKHMTWFEIDLEPGVLYVFEYNKPPGLREMMKLTGDGIEPAGDE